MTGNTTDGFSDIKAFGEGKKVTPLTKGPFLEVVMGYMNGSESANENNMASVAATFMADKTGGR